MFSSSLVMSSTLLKIGVRKEAMSKKKKNEGRVGSGENGRVVWGRAKSVTNACYCHVHQIVILNCGQVHQIVTFHRLYCSSNSHLGEMAEPPILSLYEGMVRITIPKKRGHDQCQQNNAKKCVIYSLVPQPTCIQVRLGPCLFII